MKDTVLCAADEARHELLELSHRIHDDPELGMQEHHAVQWQSEVLRHHGFEVQTPYGGLDTAYRATFHGKSAAGPHVAFLAEYDALRGVGHGCGHNVIAASSVGAGIALASVMDQMGGDVVVIGTPAEETVGGKIILAEHGAFDDIDFALMMHPATTNLVKRGGRAAVAINIAYDGRGAHSAGPQDGVNALTSLIAAFNGIDAVRQAWALTERPTINGIITAGGSASNIICDHAVAEFTARADSRRFLKKMIEDVRRAAEAGALITGAKLTFTTDLIYAERHPNHVMGDTFKANMESLGEQMNEPDPAMATGSSDIGNVSLLVPSIHEYLWIAPEGTLEHTDVFCTAAAGPRADDVVILAAKGLAMTGYDLLTDADLRQRVRAEFTASGLPDRG
ncbi:amidohydrolase [Candidatus Cryosericum septentrionale]|jgi:amidohydrolase|uniref:Peptidase M20 domain-containing protein 2 n=1 Tax=Candidatus Cryosericum septentrionale TaxID=2290913 RepID=A0A398DQF3_9BACT|nr:amidohydrolase [Candidatus Cryosericum septentrionale]RIE17455.1 M20 family peptidase [Candidatus Cryosericum septentrionale]